MTSEALELLQDWNDDLVKELRSKSREEVREDIQELVEYMEHSNGS